MREAVASSDLVELFRQAANEGRITLMLHAPPSGNVEVSPVTVCAMVFGLRPAQSRALLVLVKHEHVTRAALHVAISNGNPLSAKSIGVTICQLRKKLKPHNIAIVTRCKYGFSMPPDSKAKVRTLLAAYGADIVEVAVPAGNPGPKKAKSETA